MKSNSKNTIQAGFTLSELIVVIAIIGLMSTLVVVNFNQQRATRSVVLSQNETVTNARKVQSYALTSRRLPDGSSAQYYILTYQQNASTYTINAIDELGLYYGQNIESPTLADGAVVSQILLKGKKSETSLPCAQVAFGVPFGQIHISTTAPCNNIIQQTVADPVTLEATNNLTLELTITNPRTATQKTVTFYGLSGRIEGN